MERTGDEARMAGPSTSCVSRENQAGQKAAKTDPEQQQILPDASLAAFLKGPTSPRLKKKKKLSFVSSRVLCTRGQKRWAVWRSGDTGLSVPAWKIRPTEHDGRSASPAAEKLDLTEWPTAGSLCPSPRIRRKIGQGEERGTLRGEGHPGGHSSPS